MADLSPNSSRPGLEPSGRKERGASSGDLGHGPSSSRAIFPPSEPRPSSRTSFDALDAQVDRPARLQMILALILVLVLVAIPLYLWRRPRAESIAVSTGAGDAGSLPVLAPEGPATSDDKLVLGDTKTLSCHDPGSKKTAPDQCDHVADLEKAFSRAVEESASCVPRDAGGGSIIFVADLSFKKKSVAVSTPKEGRTLKSPKIAGTCERAVKSKLAALPFDSLKHEHARYRLSLTATYPGSAKP